MAQNKNNQNFVISRCALLSVQYPHHNDLSTLVITQLNWIHASSAVDKDINVFLKLVLAHSFFILSNVFKLSLEHKNQEKIFCQCV